MVRNLPAIAFASQVRISSPADKPNDRIVQFKMPIPCKPGGSTYQGCHRIVQHRYGLLLLVRVGGRCCRSTRGGVRKLQAVEPPRAVRGNLEQRRRRQLRATDEVQLLQLGPLSRNH